MASNRSTDQVEIDIQSEDLSLSSTAATTINHNNTQQEPHHPPSSQQKEEKTLVQEQEDQEQLEQPELGTELTRTSTLETIQKKVTTLLDNPLVPGALMILAGMTVAFQAGCNATLNRYGGRAFSSVISFAVGVACCLIFFVFDVTVNKTPPPNDRVKTAPWYAWMGGILGAYYVIINILTVPRLGAATVLSIFVCAQIIMACIIDHFALVGVQKRPFTIWRILASLGLVGCVVVIAKF